MSAYWTLARPRHWVKNGLVILPLLCSGRVFEGDRLIRALWAFCAFSLLASAVYCVNDIRDREKDRQDPHKAGRPVASGAVSPRGAAVFCGILVVLAWGAGYLAAGLDGRSWLWLGLYFLVNLGYSFGLKNLPLIDVGILAAGFLLRMLYGGQVTDIELSNWLCLTIIAVSFFMGLGKRRGELMSSGGNGRKVLAFYSEQFLGYNMYMCVTLAVLFYAMWTVDPSTVARAGSEALVWTVPLVILICMRYSLDIEGDSTGDPVEVLLHDRLLVILGLILALAVGGMIYL